MASNNTLHIFTGSENIDSEHDYGVVTLEVQGQEQYEVNNITLQEWNGEDGEEVFMPKKAMFKAYDCNVTLGVKRGINKARLIKDAFISLITGKELMIEQPYLDTIMCGCYVKKVEDDLVDKDFMTFKVTFRVTKPSDHTSLPSREPEYSIPYVFAEYMPKTIGYNGGLSNIRAKNYSQIKTTPLSDGTSKEEILTLGGTWEFGFIGSTPSYATIDKNVGTIIFQPNTTQEERSVVVVAKVHMNGKTGSNTNYIKITQSPAPAHNLIGVGQITTTAEGFKNLTASQLQNNATLISGTEYASVVNSWIYYLLIPEDVEFDYLHYSSGGEFGYVRDLADFNVKHDDIWIGSVKYKVYGMRTEPQGDTYTLKTRYK